MIVMRRELKMPSELAGVGIERKQAIGVKVIALTHHAVPVRPRVARAPEDQVLAGS